jgi:hypothetical protein
MGSYLYLATANTIGAIYGRISTAQSSNEPYVWEAPNGLSSVAEELIQNAIKLAAGDEVGSRPHLVPHVAAEARRLMLKWRLTNWTVFDGEGYLRESDDREVVRWRNNERTKYALDHGLLDKVELEYIRRGESL